MSFYHSPPPSSPASSPSPFIDSSPPSSPGGYYEDDFNDTSSSSIDPFAGSSKATRPPKIYEKKRQRSITRSPSPTEFKKTRFSPSSSPIKHDFPSSDAMDEMQNMVASMQPEAEIWDQAVNKVFKYSNGLVDLANHNLTYIPAQSLDDLGKFVTLSAETENKYRDYPLEDTNTDRKEESKSFSRTLTISGESRDKVRLMLANNHITRLPQQLFTLENMTILSLRSNSLTVLPPEIGQLTNLTDLNVANNKLRYLPSELMDLHLRHLNVSPNPFIQPPRDLIPFIRTRSRSRSVAVSRPVSDIIPIFKDCPTLIEACLRSILSPASEMSSCTLLDKVYCLPLEEDPNAKLTANPDNKRVFHHILPSLVHDILDVTCPGSVYVESLDAPTNASQNSMLLPKSSQPVGFEDYLATRLGSMTYELEYQQVTGLGKCCSPRHEGQTSVFVLPTEERFTWEHTIAGVTNLGDIPIRWRGCQRGCLDFLSPQASGAPAISSSQEATQGGEDVVQPVHITSGFAFDGFGD